MAYLETLLTGDAYSNVVIYILLISIGLLCVSSWILFLYFLTKSYIIQISFMAIFSFVASLSLSLIATMLYYLIHAHIDISPLSYLILSMVIFYAIGHTIMIIVFLDRVKTSMESYNMTNSCCNSSNIFITISFILLPIPFLSFCWIIIMPTFTYISM
eukprot:UN04175